MSRVPEPVFTLGQFTLYRYGCEARDSGRLYVLLFTQALRSADKPVTVGFMIETVAKEWCLGWSHQLVGYFLTPFQARSEDKRSPLVAGDPSNCFKNLWSWWVTLTRNSEEMLKVLLFLSILQLQFKQWWSRTKPVYISHWSTNYYLLLFNFQWYLVI